jgi:putative DNA primase/helicase
MPLVGQIEREAYPTDALPHAIRGAVEEVQDAVQAAPEMVASSALAVCSLAAQSLADVSRNKALPGPVGLYFLTVAESGDRKSTVDRLLGRAVRAFQDEQRDASRLTLATHAADLAAWEAKRDSTAGRMGSDAKAGKPIEGHRVDLAQIEGEKPRDPKIPRLIYEDVTSEKLGKALAMEWPSGGIFSSEGGAVLGGHSMGKDSIARTLGLLNKLWDGADHIVDRQTAPSFAVRGARFTINLQVQPHVMADFLDRDRGMSRGSGFLARFLISQPMSLQGMRLYKEPSDMPALGCFSARIAELLRDLPQIDPERGLVLPMLEFTPEAKALWIANYNSIEGELKSAGDFAAIKDTASKTADNIARIAAVLHVFEYGARGQISVESVDSASSIATWHAYNARALLAPFTMSKETANAATLDRWLIDRCIMEGVDGFPTRTLLQSGPTGTRKRADFEAAVLLLAEAGRARILQLGKRRTLKVNPALLDGSETMSEADAPDIVPSPARAVWNG